MATLVLTVIGDDRAGLVNALADVVTAHGGNWERSQLAELAGKFAGIVLVLDVFAGAHINSTGVVWGLAAAICAACYFMMSEKASSDGTGLSPVTLAAAGLVIGALAVAGLGATGVMPLRFSAG